MKKLNAAEIKAALGKIPTWKKKAAVISRTFQFKDFPAAMKFVNAVAEVAEKEQHHPDIDIRWNKVTLALTTHDAGGLTEKDFALAKKFDRAAERGHFKTPSARLRREFLFVSSDFALPPISISQRGGSSKSSNDNLKVP